MCRMLSFPLQDRDAFSLKLEDTENWLYEDGEDQPKQVYIDKLSELKVISNNCGNFPKLINGYESVPLTQLQKLNLFH